MKKIIMLTLCAGILTASLCGCGTQNAQPEETSADEVVLDIATTQYFTDEAVSLEDTEKILTAGINAPSAMNGQKWHFTAVTDASVLEEIAGEMSMPVGAAGSSAVTKAGLTDAPLAIIISCEDGSDFDAGLACQNMSVEAQLLGYGSKIISSPKIALNGERKAEFDEILGVPDGYSAVAVLLVGKEDTSIDESTDGYTSATTRNDFDEVVTFVE